MQRISRFRMIVFIVIILAMIGVFSLRLYKTQAVVTEAYADGKLVLDPSSLLYKELDEHTAHAMAKEIMALAETTQQECEWRISIATPLHNSLAPATILRLDYCDKSYSVTYLAVETEYEPAGWGQPVPCDSLKKPNEADDPPFLTSGAYDPDHYQPDN